MGFFKNLFKADREYEENLRKQTIEKQVKTWAIQARMGQTPNVQADMEKIYGLDKLEQKQQQKQQTKEIVKGAVIGGIVAGDAGAVVGAMVAKNNIDNRNANSSNQNHQSIGTATPPVSREPSREVSETITIEASPADCDRDIVSYMKYRNSQKWKSNHRGLMYDSDANTNNPERDVEYCISKLGVANLRDIGELLNLPPQKIRPVLTTLIKAEKVERFEYDERPFFRWIDCEDLIPAKGNNDNKFDEVKKFKELLDSGIITQEEFDAKKKQLLGL